MIWWWGMLVGHWVDVWAWWWMIYWISMRFLLELFSLCFIFVSICMLMCGDNMLWNFWHDDDLCVVVCVSINCSQSLYVSFLILTLLLGCMQGIWVMNAMVWGNRYGDEDDVRCKVRSWEEGKRWWWWGLMKRESAWGL